MKPLKIILSLAVTLALIYALNRKWGNVPPLGKFLDPFHGFWQNAEDEEPLDTEVFIPGLNEKVTVLYDSMMIPHIFAHNDTDLYVAQGYVTAQHRLWQMEFQIHAGAGRISEILGSVALDFDRRQRRLGMVFAAENALRALENDPDSKQMIANYSTGVNAFIEGLTYENYPFEYKLLDYAPEPWTGLKSAILVSNMAKTLNISERDKELTNALSLFGKETVDLLFPEYEGVGQPIVDNPGGWKFKPLALEPVPLSVPGVQISTVSRERSAENVGSNNWAVSGTKTATGSPILCNDPHLDLGLPSIWYIVHLNSPQVNTMGGSFPGAPCVVIGFNDSIAWGQTNAQRDVVDFYKIEFKDDTRNEYLSDDQWKPVKKVVEKFEVRWSDPFYDTVRYTHHGPITYDQSFRSEDEKANYAFRWIAHDPSEVLTTFYKLNRARNYDDFMEALDHFASPAQNFAFASVHDDIAMRVQGKFPVRRPQEGRFVLDGTKSVYDWQAFIPNEQNIMDKNPARGFVSSANQYPADTTYPYYINASSYEAYRNRRINTVLGSLEKVTVEDVMKLQGDLYNIKAEEGLPYFLESLDTTQFTVAERKAYERLSAWDYYADADSEGSTYFEAWLDEIMPLAWDELRRKDIALDYPTSYVTIKLLKEQPELSFFDIQSTGEKETAREVLRKSFTLAVQNVEAWITRNQKSPRWADFKDTFIGHLLRQAPLSVHVDHGGTGDAVNASTRTHGPSWRMVVSLEKSGTRAWGVYPGGQSGNPGSRYYANMIPLWAKGEYFRLPFASASGMQQRSIVTKILKPLSK